VGVNGETVPLKVNKSNGVGAYHIHIIKDLVWDNKQNLKLSGKDRRGAVDLFNFFGKNNFDYYLGNTAFEFRKFPNKGSLNGAGIDLGKYTCTPQIPST